MSTVSPSRRNTYSKFLTARWWRICFAVALAVTPGVARTGAAATADPFARLDAVVATEMRANDTPGASVAVVVGDRVVYAKGFGVASVETGALVDADTLFRIASTTKMMTAAAVLVEADRGKVDLDVPVGRYVSNLPRETATATVRQLLTHTAGLRDETVYFGRHDDTELGQFIRGWKDDVQIAPPGDVYSYSNLGYDLAGYVLERRAGRAFADEMRAALFAPLGMKRTTLRPIEAMTYPFAQGHEPTDTGPAVVRPFADNARYWPNGGVFTSANDYSLFAIAMLNGGKVGGRQALAPSVVSQMLEAYAEVPGNPNAARSFYGYGLNVRTIGGRRVLQHGGERIGFGSLFRMIPDRGIAVIVLSNRTGAPLVASLEAATEIALTMPRPTALPAPVASPKPPWRSESAIVSDLRPLLGRYANGVLHVSLTADGERIVMRGNGEGTSIVEKLPDGRYVADGQPLTFVRGARSGRTYLFLAGRALRRAPG